MAVRTVIKKNRLCSYRAITSRNSRNRAEEEQKAKEKMKPEFQKNHAGVQARELETGCEPGPEHSSRAGRAWG